MTLAKEVHKSREWVITQLRQQGLSAQDIAYEMGLTESTVYNIASSLVKIGKIKKLSNGPKKGSGNKTQFWRNLDHSKTQTIIKMVKARATQQEIAKVLGVISRERARQLIGDMEAVHGFKVWESEKELYSIPEAAKILKVSLWLIRSICRENVLPLQERGEHQYLLGEKAMEILRHHPRITGKGKCAVCKNDFTRKRRFNCRTMTCCKKCKKIRVLRLKQSLFNGNLKVDSLAGWHIALHQKLQAHKSLEGEKWLKISEATGITTLSKMQIWYLGRRGIVATCNHSAQVSARTGKPITMYSSSQMEIARQVYRAHQQKYGVS